MRGSPGARETGTVLDACALIAYFAKENGAENVKGISKNFSF
jgi:PIN domain nuclease of toxin-antitoxin system